MIFVDTSFWIGETVTGDSTHDAAASLAGRLRGEAVITSNLILGEVGPSFAADAATSTR